MDVTSTEYLELITKNPCFISFQKGVPAGKLKRELIALADHKGRLLTLRTPQGFSACPVEIPRAFFDEYLTSKYIEQYGPEDAEGRILFRITRQGEVRAHLAQAVNDRTVETYSDFSP
jgi:hypothetical protein